MKLWSCFIAGARLSLESQLTNATLLTCVCDPCLELKILNYFYHKSLTKEQSVESLEDLFKTYPIEQWWRLFIDGVNQYSLINREPSPTEISMRQMDTNYTQKIIPACARYDFGGLEGGESGYMTSSLYTFFSLMDNVNEPLSVKLIKKIHSDVTKNLLRTPGNSLASIFKPGEFRDETRDIGFFLHMESKYSDRVTVTKEGMSELLQQQSILGIQYEEKYKNTKNVVRTEPCPAIEVEKKLLKIIEEYEHQIAPELNQEIKIKHIANMVQKLERLHPFCDGNCRTFCMQILNKELLRNKMYPTIMYDPNCFDGFSLDQMVDEIKEGQSRFIKILNLPKVEGKVNDDATLSFKLGPFPNIKQPFHEQSDPFIKLNDEEMEYSMNFIEAAISMLPDSSNVKGYYRDIFGKDPSISNKVPH